MIASKTSFVLAAVALSAVSSAYAAPASYNTGSDLATRGFEEDESALEARFFDDELEARDLSDVEEGLFARAIDSPGTKLKAETPHHRDHDMHHNHHVPRAMAEQQLSGEHVHSPFASQKRLQKLESHRPVHSDNGQHSGHERYGHFMPSGKHAPGTEARLTVQAQHKNKRGFSDLWERLVHGGDENHMHRRGKGGQKQRKGKQHKNKQHKNKQRKNKQRKDKKRKDKHQRKQGKYGKRNVPAPEHALPSAVQERGLTEDEMVIVARSLGLDDNYFLEERSFEDEYEY